MGQKKFIHCHLYWDIEYVQEDGENVETVSMNAIMNKVIIHDTEDGFLVNANLNKHIVHFYGRYSYSSQYGFEKITQKQMIDSMQLFASNPPSNKSIVREQNERKFNFNEQKQMNTDDSDDECELVPMRRRKKSIMALRSPSLSESVPLNKMSLNNLSKSQPKKRRFRRTKKSKNKKVSDKQNKKRLTKKDILRKNKNISEEDKKEMNIICDKLGIAMNIGVQLYGFKDKGYLKVYQSALDLVQNYNDKERAFFIFGKKGDWLRDIHAAIGGKGRRGYTKEMKEGIVEKCKELKANLNKYKTLNDDHTFNNDEIEFDTESDDNLPLIANNEF